MEKALILKYIENTATEEEIEMVVEWLNADEKNMHEYLQLRHTFDISLWHENKSDKTSSNNVNRKIFRYTIFKEVLKITAIALVAIGIYHLMLSGSNFTEKGSGYQTIYTPEGQRVELTLSDGTKVWLNAKSTLIFPDKFTQSERSVKLEGEAYFDVAKEKTRQFVVETQDYNVQVLGTEFNVRNNLLNSLFEVSLIDGSVRVISNDNSDEIVMQPGDIVYADGGLLVQSTIQDYDALAWKEGILSFNDLPLKDILDRLALYYDVEFTIKNKRVLEDKYTGKFYIKDGVDQVLRVLHIYNNFSYTKDEFNHITIY